MELLNYFKKNPEQFNFYLDNLNKTIKNVEMDEEKNRYNAQLIFISSLISFTIGFFISKIYN